MSDKIAYLEAMGWYLSVESRISVNAKNEPIPWFAYPIIHFLEEHLSVKQSDWSVFEFGCGTSTLWWALRVGKIISVEHDVLWIDKIKPYFISAENCQVMHKELVRGGDYCRTCAETGEEFDIIVIDGRDRVNCLLQSLSCLKDRGVVIFDNTERPEYSEAYEHLKSKGYKKLNFVGMAPMNAHASITSVFYRDDNIFDI